MKSSVRLKSERSPEQRFLERVRCIGRQIKLMARHRCRIGAIPQELAGTIAVFESQLAKAERLCVGEREAEDTGGASGARKPDDAFGALEKAYKTGMSAHGRLTELIKPATVDSLLWATEGTTGDPRDDLSARAEFTFFQRVARLTTDRVFFLGFQFIAGLVCLSVMVGLLYDAHADGVDRQRAEAIVEYAAALEALPAPSGAEAAGEGALLARWRLFRERAEALRRNAESLAGEFASDEEMSGILAEIRRGARGVVASIDLGGGGADAEDGFVHDPTSGERGRVEEAVRSLNRLAGEWASMLRVRGAAGAPDTDPPDYLLLVFSGALGAAFFNLYNAYRYLINRTFNPSHIFRYYARLLLGAIAGLILGYFGSEILTAATQMSAEESTPTLELSRAFLALIGGVAVDAVFLILIRISNGLAALFQGDPNDRLEVDRRRAEFEAERREGQRTQDARAKLAVLKQSVPEGLEDTIQEIIDELRA